MSSARIDACEQTQWTPIELASFNGETALKEEQMNSLGLDIIWKLEPGVSISEAHPRIRSKIMPLHLNMVRLPLNI